MPNIFDYNPQNIHPFPYWKWNKVLPAVYDDSLSQYEILCKLLHVVNNIIESTNSTGEQVEQLTQLVQQLIDGEFPSGLVQYVTDIANAAVDDDIDTINDVIDSMQQEIDSFEESTQSQIDNMSAIYSDRTQYSDKDSAVLTNISNPYIKNWNGIYEVSTDELFVNDIDRFAFTNKDGDMLLPIIAEHNCGGAVNPLPSIINVLSYMDKQNVIYGSTNSVFSLSLDTVATDLVCTEYVMLYLNGTPYELSKFNGVPNLATKYRANIPNDIQSYLNGNVIHGSWNNRELAFYAVSNGNYSFSNDKYTQYMKPGDVIIWANENNPSNNNLWDISHCAIVVDICPINGFFTVIEGHGAATAQEHSFCISTHSQTLPDGVSMNIRDIEQSNTGNFIIFHPVFDVLNTVNVLNEEHFTLASNTLGGVTSRVHTSEMGVTIPAYTFVYTEISCESLYRIFVDNPTLSYISYELRANNLASGSSFSSDDFITRNRIFRTDILNDSKYIDKSFHCVGYTHTPVSRFACYLGVDGDNTGTITLNNIEFNTYFYGI